MTNNADKTLVVTVEESNASMLRAVALEGTAMLKEEDEEEIDYWPFACVAEPIKGILTNDNLANKPMTLAGVLAATEKAVAQLPAKTEKTVETTTEKEKPVSKIREIGPIHVMNANKKLLKIKFSSTVWDKIRTWVEMTTEEISGVGCVTMDPGNTFTVYDTFLLKQENTSAFTDIDDQSVHDLMWELIQKDDEDNGHRVTDLKFWWHSHADMGVNWSGQDDSCILKKLQHADWWLSMVINRRGQYNTRLDTRAPAFRFDNLDCELMRPAVSPVIREFCQKEYDDKVTERNHPYVYTGGAYNQHSYNRAAGYSHYKEKELLPELDRRRTPQTGHKASTNYAGIVRQTEPPTLKTTKWAPILYPANGELFEIKATPSRAKALYSQEIDAIKDHVSNTLSNLNLGVGTYTGYAFYPKIIEPGFRGEEFVRWSCTGLIGCTSKHYLITLYHDEPGVVCVSRITKLCQSDHNRFIAVTNSIKIPNNRFATIGIEYEPCFETKEQNVTGPFQGVGIIFEAENEWPENALGSILCGDLEEFMIDEEEAEDTIEEETESGSVTEGEAGLSLLEEVEEYSYKVPEEELEKRIEDIVRTADKPVLVDILEALADKCPADADDQELADNAVHFREEQLAEHIMRFAKRNAREAFPWVWNCLPCRFVCLSCYEPTKAEDIVCPHCKSDLNLVADEEEEDA